MKLKLAGVGVAVLLVVSLLGASAFTSASLDRSANVNVVSDDVGLIALEDGTSGPLVSQNSSGALAIDFTNASGSGVNTEATYTLGDEADPSNRSAFNITNNGGETHTIDVNYSADVADGDADQNLQFKIYDGSNTLVDTASEEGSGVSLPDVPAGTTYYVVIVADTHGLSTSDDLSGTLTVSA